MLHIAVAALEVVGCNLVDHCKVVSGVHIDFADSLVG